MYNRDDNTCFEEKRKEKVCERAMNKDARYDCHPYPSALSLPNGRNTVVSGQEHKSSRPRSTSWPKEVGEDLSSLSSSL